MSRRHGVRAWWHTAWLAIALVLVVSCTDGTDGTSDTTETPTTFTTPTTTTLRTTTTTSGTTTSSPSAVAPGQLLVMGDWGSGTEPEGAVSGAMARRAGDEEVSAILTTGDNFYSDDTDFIMHPYDWALSGDIDFWVTWGNHDVESDDRAQAVDQIFSSPQRWSLHRWGLVDVVILDSNQVDSDEQIQFLQETLSASDRPTIVVFHHPAFSCGRYEGYGAIVDTWLPLFDPDVFLVLNGHDHNYQRFRVDQVTYVVTGGGGKSLYSIGECGDDQPPLLSAASTHHFVSLGQTEGAVTLEAIDVNGDIVDRIVLDLP